MPFETPGEFINRITHVLDALPIKSILITHTDFIQNALIVTHFMSDRSIVNCSVTYIHQNRLIWLAREINAQESRS